MHARFPVTVHMFLFQNGKILLSRRCRTGYMDGFYSVPAGHLDGEETVRMAAVRETREEIGIKLDVNDVVFVGVFHRHEGEERVDFFVQIRKWIGEPVNAEPEKCDDLRWVDVNELPQNTVPYIRRAIQNFHAGISFDEFGW